jgi:hypothetical protein
LVVFAASWLLNPATPVSVVPGVQVASQLFEAPLTGRLGGADGKVGVGDPGADDDEDDDDDDDKITLLAVTFETDWFCSISSWPFPRLIPTFEPDCAIAACTAAKLVKP